MKMAMYTQRQICLQMKMTSDNEREVENVYDGAILRLFNSDTEEEEFNGFSEKEEGQRSMIFGS